MGLFEIGKLLSFLKVKYCRENVTTDAFSIQFFFSVFTDFVIFFSAYESHLTLSFSTYQRSI